MPNIQIKNVPAATHAVLRRRADAAHQSLQEYLLEKLIADAEQPSLAEVFADIERQPPLEVPLDVITEAVRQDRDSR
jgi:antitoxin FitA